MNRKYLCKMTIKGQLQIPAEVRHQFDMKHIQSHQLWVEGDKIIIQPAPSIDGLRKQLRNDLLSKGWTPESLREAAKKGLDKF